jgi:hypothetical protein
MRVFDRKLLNIKPLSLRKHDLDLSVIKSIGTDVQACPRDEKMSQIGKRILRARDKGSSVILMMGGHVIRAGVQNYLIDLMKKGYISCIAMNGAGMIHDFELALIGATTESVARYVKEGQFGLWKETAILNDIINESYKKDNKTGMGEAVGRYIEEQNLENKSVSILANAYKLNIPVTVHVGIGYDIIHEHPNCDGAATGALSYNDFLKFASIVQRLENGVVMNFGSSIMAPEVFLKALSMARNVSKQEGKEIKRFTTVVCDLLDLPDNFRDEPSRGNPAYYFRPWKTMLIRTVADGGESFYIKGRHEETIPSLWRATCIPSPLRGEGQGEG